MPGICGVLTIFGVKRSPPLVLGRGLGGGGGVEASADPGVGDGRPGLLFRGLLAPEPYERS